MNDMRVNAAPDPFAPLTLDDASAEPIEPEIPGKDVWEPLLPAPEEPPKLTVLPRWKDAQAVARWVYRDDEGKPLFAAVRFTLADGTKDTIPYTFGRRVWTTKRGKRQDMTGWHYKRPLPPLPLYGLDRLAQRPDAPVLVCEGEKAADAAATLFPDHVGITSQGGAKAAGKSDWTPLAGRAVTIWPDNDAAGLSYAEDVAHLLREVGAANVRVVEVPQNWPEGWDLADDPPEGRAPDPDAEGDPLAPTLHEPWAAALARMVAQAKPPGPPPRMPNGFRMIRGGQAPGLYFFPAGKPGKEPSDPVWVTAPFEVVGEANDGSGQEWGTVLRWWDRDGRTHLWSVPKRLVHEQGNEIAAQLEGAGLTCGLLGGAHSYLKLFINTVRAPRRLRCVDRTGWHDAGGKPVFILTAAESFGPGAEDVILQSERIGSDAAYRARGTLAEWRREVARYADGNDRLALFVSAAFAGPLLDIGREASGGVHLVGRSQSGKSTALYCAGSVWGRGDAEGQIRQWRATANGLEGVTAQTSDALLILDEMSQASAREVGDVVYMLANNSGKLRGAARGGTRRTLTWRTLFLSTGEVTLAAKMAEAGTKPMAGQEVRLVNVPADAGAGLGTFQALHGKADGGALARHLRDATRTYYGTAARAFLARLARERAEDVEAVRGFLADLRAGFVAKHVPAGADGQVRSVADRFALIGAAGELARDYGVLPWPEGEAMRAAGACFRAWLGLRGGTDAAEDRQAVAQVRAFIEAHGESRFTLIGREAGAAPPLEIRTVNRAGFRCKVGTDDGDRWEYLILPETWKAEVCKGLDPKRAAQVLAARGLLAVEGKGHLTVKRRLPDLGQPRVYAVQGAILAGDDAE
ncbi:MAG TPA: DUF927 domain-containing protein [Acetobacteraceae bacterium]|nr:DUF927 domain-containing protein [Acetobacteraceae bacterium]